MTASGSEGDLKPRIFIGSSIKALRLAEAIRSKIRHQTNTTLWNEGPFNLMSTAIEDLLSASRSFDFAIFVFHPEDQTEIREKKQLTVRDNVLFELGLFMGSLGRERCFFVVPTKRENLRIPTDLTGVNPAEYDLDNENVVAAVGDACFRIMEAVIQVGPVNRGVENLLYSSIRHFEPTDFRGIEAQVWRGGKAEFGRGRGQLTFSSDGALRVQRENTEGKFEIQLRPGGPKDPSFPKKVDLSYRRLRVRCEGFADVAPHVLEFIFKDEQRDKWLANQRFRLTPNQWSAVDLHFKVPSDVDLLFRIDDLDPTQVPSAVTIRHLVITERNEPTRDD